MNKLEREGIFKVRPLNWYLQPSDREGSQAIAVSIEFLILAQLEGAEWTSWDQYEDHSVVGWFYIVKADGTVDSARVQDLHDALGWNGDPDAFAGGVPDVVVQVTVKGDVYNGRTSYKAAWIRPGDFTPRPKEATPEAVSSIKKRYGSLFRAAASGATKAAPGKTAPPKLTPKEVLQDENNLPF